MTSEKPLPPAVLVAWTLSLIAVLLVAGCQVAGRTPGGPAATPAGVTFAECQKSAEYTTESGATGRYAVEFDNGVCTVQKP